MSPGLLPEGGQKHDRRPHPTAFLRGVSGYLFHTDANRQTVIANR